MKKSLIGLIACSTLIFTACGNQGSGKAGNIEGKINEGKALASRDGIEIHEGYIELLQSVNPGVAGQLKTPAGKKRLVNNLLDQEILFREAVKNGIPSLPKYQEKAALYERVIYGQGLLEEKVSKKAKAYYDENKEEEFNQVGIAHILIRIQNPKIKSLRKGAQKGLDKKQALAKAKEAKKKLDEGVAWEEVVEEYSDDRLTKKRGGDLGKINKQDRRAQRLQWGDLIDAAFTLKEGEYSEPLKARDGYHIIKVTEVAQVAPFEEIENRLKFKLGKQVKTDLLKDLSGGETTEYLVEELKVPGAPAAGARPGFPGAGANLPVGKPGAPKLGANIPGAQPKLVVPSKPKQAPESPKK